MSFKFSTGQAVEYKPNGGMLGLYTVIRQMPEEFRAFDRKYRIKSDQEGFERTVLECDLQESNGRHRIMRQWRPCAGRVADSFPSRTELRRQTKRRDRRHFHHLFEVAPRAGFRTSDRSINSRELYR